MEVVQAPDKKRPHLLMISLDGTPLDLIKRWDLPFLNSLMETGRSGILKSIFPPHTLIAFASLLTGTDPAHHGVYNYVVPDEGRLRPVTGRDLRAKTFMETLSEAGIRVASINVPMTSSLHLRNGFVVGSWDSPPGERYFHPPELDAALRRFDYEIVPYAIGERKLPKIAYEIERKRTEFAKYMLKTYPIDLLMIHYYGTELLHHKFGSFLSETSGRKSLNYETIVAAFYQKLDGLIRSLVMDANPKNVIVLSDHGSCALEGVVDINQVLADHSLLAFDKLKRTVRMIYVWLESQGNNLLTYRLGTWVYDKRKRGVGPPIIWQRTKAFCTSQLGSVRVNLRFRERFGVVDPNEYEPTRQTIIKVLGNLSVVDKIYSKEELYNGSGPFMHEIDDLYVKLRRGRISLDYYGRKERSHHTMDGMLIRSGSDVLLGDVADIRDVTAIICSTFNVKHSPDLKGTRTLGLKTLEEAEMMRRLRGLGYLG